MSFNNFTIKENTQLRNFFTENNSDMITINKKNYNVKIEQESIYDVFINLKLDNCSFKNIINEMKNYQSPSQGNNHHRGSLLEHSIWTAKTAEYIWSIPKNSDNWIKFFRDQFIPIHFKNFTILAGFFHDIGKLDGKINVNDFIKPKHPSHGYDIITKPERGLYNVLDICINPFTNNMNYNILMAYLAIISKHHQDLGDVMQKKITPDFYIKNIFDSVAEFPTEMYSFRKTDLDFLIPLTIFVSLCDVVGARPMNIKSEWQVLNKYKLSEELDYFTKNREQTPWFRYGYEKNGNKVVTEILKSYQKQKDNYFNTKKEGIGSNVDLKTMKLFNLFDIKYSIIPKGVYYYKSMSTGTITAKAHQNFKDVSWFGSEHTAVGYLPNSHFGGFTYQFQSRKDLKLIRLDDTDTIVSLLKICQYLYERNSNMKNKNNFLVLANKLQFAWGVGLEKRMSINEFDFNKPFFFNSKFTRILRNSYHNIDKDILVQLLCPLMSIPEHNLDGYIANPFLNFHEEIALCKPWEDMKFIKLYKKFDFNTGAVTKIGGKNRKTKKQTKEDLLKIIKKHQNDYCKKKSKRELVKSIEKYSKDTKDLKKLKKEELQKILKKLYKKQCKINSKSSKKQLLDFIKKL